MNIFRHLPNTITCLNLISGGMAVIFAFRDDFDSALGFVILAAVFDFLDGFTARLLHAYSETGKELDSLSDVVSFGLAPSFIAYDMVVSQLVLPSWMGFIVLLMALASAYRLGKFNIDEEQKKDFKGMPTPANALFWAALGLHWVRTGFVLNVYFILLLSILMALLLVSSFRMFSLKGGGWRWKSKRMVYLFFLLAVVLVCVFGFLGIAASVVLYPVFSFLHFAFDRGKPAAIRTSEAGRTPSDSKPAAGSPGSGS